MLILGIETSCDECSCAIVESGKKILSNIVVSQIDFHKPFNGVVPEIASRKHVEFIIPVVNQGLSRAGCNWKDIGAIAVTFRPGLIGSLLVGLSFAKGLAFSLDLPFIGIDHIEAHMYASHLEFEIKYPYLGVLVSGGHTIIAQINDFDDFEVLGTTIDDACGEAFDKVAKHYGLGYPGGEVIDKLAKKGNIKAFNFPHPSLHKGNHEFDVSYSGLKNAVANQLDLFWNKEYEKTVENIAACFQKTAIDILVKRILKAINFKSIDTVVFGGGVAANSYLRQCFNNQAHINAIFPRLELCTDNAAMVAGLAYHKFIKGKQSNFNLNAQARVPGFRRLVK